MKKKVEEFKKKIQPFFSRYRILAGLYYLFLDRKFGREQQKVLKGKIAHEQYREKRKANLFLLIRNIHRIEKGILMKPRRDLFALDYIGETLDAFEGLWGQESIEKKPQMKWFHDVLSRYFEITKKRPEVKEYRDRFKNKVANKNVKYQFGEEDIYEHSYSPYLRDLQPENLPTYEAFYNLTRHRRSVRWFQDKKVSREIIDKALLAGLQSPSACNRQPFEYRVFDDPKAVKEVASIPMGTKGYAHNVRTFVVIVGNLDAYFHERDRHNIYIDGALSAMSFILALESMGVSSCPVNWPDIEQREQKMMRFLNLKEFQRPVMCMSIGYPDPEGMVGFSAKRSLEQIRKYN